MFTHNAVSAYLRREEKESNVIKNIFRQENTYCLSTLYTYYSPLLLPNEISLPHFFIIHLRFLRKERRSRYQIIRSFARG